ncbi:hypothetical protein A3K93_09480 [Acinetobacter sp. NCu2D-2]|uniref:tetratricopeptide repeat protein n=1 Tax=Acinetobacter sp. NCu2D-2 TaxID=1608473 RepID=UPI0007CDA379|nr:tetratricopeptide repeat protein [Acinetobacter sp. NCu2D-2]ANF82403.1 hypothetical protein A3K93_09480 [Acinetobacter sp. NCu2D-2]
MKKILLAALVAVSTQFTFANTAPASTQKVDPEFAKIEQLVNQKNFKGAYNALSALANKGNAQAIYNLGYLTQTGQGTKKDEKRAIQLYQQASDKGYPIASYVLGKNYAAGTLGLTQDINKAKQLFDKASKNGLMDASIDYAVLMFSENKPESDKKGLERLAPLIKAGNQQAIHAKALYDISNGFKLKDDKPIKAGLESIQNLAKQGYIPALMAMGNMLANGKIVEQNLPEAKKIFGALAENNVPQAKESLQTVEKMIAEQGKKPAQSATTQKKS